MNLCAKFDPDWPGVWLAIQNIQTHMMTNMYKMYSKTWLWENSTPKLLPIAEFLSAENPLKKNLASRIRSRILSAEKYMDIIIIK